MTPEEVKAAYSHQYPELATAAITGPEAIGEHLVYSFVNCGCVQFLNSSPKSYNLNSTKMACRVAVQ